MKIIVFELSSIQMGNECVSCDGQVQGEGRNRQRKYHHL